MGFAKAAELTGYPGPKHVLDLAQQLKLTQAQRQQLQGIFDRMSAAAKPLGTELVERERAALWVAAPESRVRDGLARWRKPDSNLYGAFPVK